MKAFTIVAPGQTAVSDVPEPKLGPQDVLLRVHLVGFCGSDLNTYRGRNPMVTYPRIPGHEIAATVLRTGPDVPAHIGEGLAVTVSPYTNCGTCASCRRGRANACERNQTLGVQRDGAMTERIAVPWQKLVAAPALGFRELALVEPLTVGFHAVERGRVSGNDTVAVLGCGAIGLGAIAGAAFRGATVVAIDIDPTKLELAARAGAAYLVDSSRQSLHDELVRLTDARGPDVVIEAIGLPQTYRAAVEEVAFTGRVVYIGYAKEPVPYETKLFVQKELDIMGSRNATPDNFRDVVAMLETGDFPTDAIISRTVPLADAGRALAEWDAAPADVTKILVDVSAHAD